MKESSRGKYLLKNTAVFAIGNLGTRLIHFFLVPLYTYVLTAPEYGTVDLLMSISSMIIPLLMCNIGEAVRRYLLDKDADPNRIRAVTYIWNGIGVIVSILIFAVLSRIPGCCDYALVMALYVLSNAFLQTTQDYLRGKEKLGLYTLCSMYNAFCSAALNILFLAIFNWGIKGYFGAYILSNSTAAILSFAMGKQYRDIRKLKWDMSLFKQMSAFALTLVPNSIMWWVMSSSNRLMVTYYVSASANGLFAVAYKLPSLLSTFSTILMQAWQYSAVRESDSSDKEAYNNKMFQVYFSSIAMIAAGLLLVLRPFMLFYVAPEYYEAWKYSPFLIIGLMFQILGTFVGTSYFVEKDMRGNLTSSVVGAIANVGLNLVMIPTLQAQGAAIATCISYLVILVYRVWDTKKYVYIKVVTPLTIKVMLALLAMVISIYIPGIISNIILAVEFVVVLWHTRAFFTGIIKRVLFREEKRRNI